MAGNSPKHSCFFPNFQVRYVRRPAAKVLPLWHPAGLRDFRKRTTGL